MWASASTTTTRAVSALVLCASMLAVSGCAGRPAAERTVIADGEDDADGGSSSSVVEDRSAPVTERPRRRSASERVRKNLPNILLYTQENEPVRFYDDLVKDKIVLIYFMFTICEGICPATTANVARMQDLLGDLFGRDTSLSPSR